MSVSVHGGGSDEDVMIARPKKNNPNVAEVFQPVASPSVPVSVAQQQKQNGQKKRVDDTDGYDALLGKYVRPHIGLRIIPPVTGASGALPPKEKDEADDGGVYDDDEVILMDDGGGGGGSGGGGGKKREMVDVDGDPGGGEAERQELIDFEAAKRHLEAKARVLSDPVIQFVAAIAGKTGTGLQNMLVNASLPLVNVNAKSVEELLNGSRMHKDYLLVLLAQVLVEQQKTLFAMSMPPTLVGASPLKRQKGGGGGGGDDDAEMEQERREVEELRNIIRRQQAEDEGMVPVKEEPVKATIDCAISLIERAARTDQPYELIGVQPQPPGIFRLPRLGQAGQGGGGGQQGGGGVTDRLAAFLREMTVASDVVTWAWNQMPENSGLALIKPEVIAMIQMAYEDIRAISAQHATFKLWHLITGPRVRQHFSMMIAAMLNAAPSEIQYPHYQRSVRDNGAVTGARVSSGSQVIIRSAQLYKEKLWWFKSVGYQESAQWKALRERQEAGVAQSELEIARRTLDRCEADLIRQMDTFWASLTPVTREITGDLFDALQRPLSEVPEDVRRGIQRTLVDSSPRTLAGATPTIGRVLMANGAGLVPFAPGYEADGLETPYMPAGHAADQQPDVAAAAAFLFTRRPLERLIGSPERYSESVLLTACNTALMELETITRRIAGWTTSVAAHQQVIYNLTGAFERFKAAILAVKAATRQVIIEQRQVEAITEDAKRELVYNRINTRPPMRDYSLPYSRYASE